MIQLPPSFTVNDFRNIERFLDRLPNIDRNNKYDYAIESRHPFMEDRRPMGNAKAIYNIATVITDSPANEHLQFLSDVVITADHSFIRFHGRNTKGHYWYNYLYSKQELEPWVDKVNQIKNQTEVLRVYFNNHYGGKAVANALQFKEMTGTSLTQLEMRALEHAEKYLAKEGL